MKTSIFVLALILSSGIFGQKTVVIKPDSAIPEKGNNLIKFISDSLSNFDLFKECVNVLKDMGCLIDKLDKDFFIVTTQVTPTRDKSPAAGGSDYKLDISVSDNIMLIRSYMRSNTSFKSSSGTVTTEASTDQPWERGANRSLSTSLWRYGWNKQMEFAENLKKKVSGKIQFITE